MSQTVIQSSESRQVDAPSGSFRRRDHLSSIEKQIQKLWKERRVYEATAPQFQEDLAGLPVGEFDNKDEKFFCTFPYPYMNGRLHLGHAFTLSKAEFQARYQRLNGKHVLWPFAFHCTGMPIPACADKLKRELFEKEEGSSDLPSESPESPESVIGEAVDVKEVGKFSGKKSKAG